MPRRSALQLVTLNIGRGFPSLERSIAFLGDTPWDVACIQDLQETHVPLITKLTPKGAVHFVPMTKHLIDGIRVPVGIGIFSRALPFEQTQTHAYVGNVAPVLDLDGVAGGNDAYPEDLARVRETESRLLLYAQVTKDGSRFLVGTTHGIWAPMYAVIPDQHQQEGMKRLLRIIASSTEDTVIAGDFNILRHRRIYQMLTRDGVLRDWIPKTITNSVDWPMRNRPYGPDCLVDYIFTSGPRYKVSDVQLHFGVSDHAAITATVHG